MAMKEIFTIEEDSENEKTNSIAELESKMRQSLLSSLNGESKKNIKILLSEDSDDDFFFISEALYKSNLTYELNWVRDGAQTIQWLNESYDQGILPDLLLLDINMPKVNGHEVLAQLRSDPRFKNLLIIILTTSKSPNDIEKAYKSGANSFIVKNSKFNKLIDALNALKTFWFETAELPIIET